jgi:hypothetical protein
MGLVRLPLIAATLSVDLAKATKLAEINIPEWI